MSRTATLEEAIAQRILCLDGAMGTQIQLQKPTAADFHGSQFADHPVSLVGCNDVLCLTKPSIIESIHCAYLEAGADIIETNSFNSQRISLSDYGLEDYARPIACAAAKVARKACDRFSTPQKPRFVAGSIGPTNRSASLSPDVSDPGKRNVDFDALVTAYRECALGLIDGGVDLILIETIFDTLNCKAAIYAAKRAMEERNIQIPLMISATLSDRAGRLLAGQTLEAFWNSVRDANPWSIGLNCAFGVAEMRPHIEMLSRLAHCFVSAHPNAGLPNALGQYDQTPEFMAEQIRDLAKAGHLNIVGGCCGTSPAHIAAIAKAVQDCAPRIRVPREQSCRLSGLEPLNVNAKSLFVNVGERCNVAGSARFRNAIRKQDFDRAIEIARSQVEGGVQMIDINMDDPMLDAESAMVTFLRLCASEPAISRVPFMIDSSRFELIELGLKNLQGKGAVNSLSLKEGEEAFLQKARIVQRYGAAVIVMAFDEQGQADSLDRRVQICKRAYNLLTTKANFDPNDIIFDPNIFAIGTGIPEHDRYALDFLEATRILKRDLPGVHVSGGLSNLSFAFKGNDALRGALHTVFLYHAIQAGMDFAIVNPAQLGQYESIDPELRDLLEDLIFARRPDASERILGWVAQKPLEQSQNAVSPQQNAWRQEDVESRIAHALMQGVDSYLAQDLDEAHQKYTNALSVIEGPLMAAMEKVGEQFRAGKLFLPQVIKSARIMKDAVAHLRPHIEAEQSKNQRKKGHVVIATVRGDVHDIGKNIVALVLECSGYEVTDLGVMVPTNAILEAIQKPGVDALALSGLISPSLEAMAEIAREMEHAGHRMPLLIGGATTSKLHTALKLAPLYSGPVVHCLDPQSDVSALNALLNPEKSEAFMAQLRTEQSELRSLELQKTLTPIEEARAGRPQIDWQKEPPLLPDFWGVEPLKIDWERVVCNISWDAFFHALGIAGKFPELLDHPERGPAARALYKQAKAQLTPDHFSPRGCIGLFHAHSESDDIIVTDPLTPQKTYRICTLRQQQFNTHRALADWIAPSPFEDAIGFFAVTAGDPTGYRDDEQAFIAKALADRIAESLAESAHLQLARHFGLLNDCPCCDHAQPHKGIRPAPGYPACPDHSEKSLIFNLLNASDTIGLALTESYALQPQASIAGYFFAHPRAQYFNLGAIGRDQLQDYARRKQITEQQAKSLIAHQLS